MRILMWLTLGFAPACALGAWWVRGSLLLVLAAAAGLTALVCGWFGRRFGLLRPAALVLLGLAAGCLWFRGFSDAVLLPAARLDGRTVPVTVRVSSYGWETDYGTAVRGTAELEGNSYKLQLYLSEHAELSPGDEIRTTARLRLTDRGGSREPTFHRGNGIFLLAYQKGSAEIQPGAPGIRDLPVLVQQAGLARIGRILPQDTRGFAAALLLGDRNGLTYENRTDFKVTGISHIVAVSGLHLSMLFGLIYVLAGKNRFGTPVIGIPCALFFAAMVGLTPSVRRSAIMLSLYMLSLAFDREYDPPTALAAAVLCMLVHNPLVITSVGFQMSVSSVAGIFLFYRPIRSWLWERTPKGDKRRIKGIARWLTASVSVTVSATVLSAPLAAWYFGAWSLVSVGTNLLVLPVIGTIFCLILVICLTAGMPLVPAAAGWAASVLIRYVLRVSHLLGQLPAAAVYTTSPYVCIWLLFLGALTLHVVCSRFRRPVLTGTLAVFGLLVALGCAWAEPLLDSYRVTVLDVGQGQCVLLQSGANTVLVDCGGSHDEDAADAAAETLLGMGISRIDGLIISHYDRDHCGGAEFLAERIRIDRAFLPVPEEEGELSLRVREGLRDSEVFWLDSDRQLRFGDCTLTIFVPKQGGSDNESSAAVLFQKGKYDTLITGDLPASGEEALLRQHRLPDLEVLVVGHHGSKTSTTQALLDACAPDVAMISAGRNNRYGHPAQEVLQRLSQAGCRILRTDTMGTITYRR